MLNQQSRAASIYRRTWLAAAAVALALAGAGASASAQRQALDIESFGKVDDTYYRGGQPRAGQYAGLKRLGIKTVVDLRKDSRQDAPGWARAAGLAYVNLPLEASQPATEGQTAEFLRLVNDPANWPVYVHCKGGRHLTGALTAVYRITRDGWTADQAFGEMLKYDFDSGLDIFGAGGRARQKRFVYAFYERHASAQDPARAN